MTKIPLLFLLALASSAALTQNWRSQWTKVATGNGGTHYADAATRLRGVDGTVRMWRLIDLDSAQYAGSGRFLSIQAEDEYDCHARAVRVRYVIFHSNHMARGPVVFTADPTAAHNQGFAPAATQQADLLRVACS